MPTALIKRLVLLLSVIAASSLGTPSAHALTTYARTWVSGAGTNNSECSVTTPCQTFAQAIGVTASGGEIDCLDPGDFGAVTISISVTIDCERVSNGGITQTAGGADAITVNTADTVVNLIGLDINGVNSFAVGVVIEAAAVVNIRNCKIYGFSTNYGLSISTGTLVIDNVLVTNNGTGIWVYNSGGVANMTVRNSNINNNGTGIIVGVYGGTHGGATIEQSTLAFNTQYGLEVYNSGAVAVLGGSTLVNNATAVVSSSGGTIYSFKNNQIGGNATDGTPLTGYPGGPLN